MNTSDFNYDLPEELIATKPAEKRDGSKLLVLNKENGETENKEFRQIINYFKSGDIFVLNNTKVIPARLVGRKQSGGKVEILLNSQILENTWDAIGKNLKVGDKITFNDSKLIAFVIGRDQKIYKIKFNLLNQKFWQEVNKIGLTPLPPYIQKKIKTHDEKFHRRRYQTDFAELEGSVAAPTAGLHMTSELLSEIEKIGVKIVYLTLHVGLGTFAPIREDVVENHKIHKEYFQMKPSDYNLVKKVKDKGGRVFACGTTTVRVLEHLSSKEALLGSLSEKNFTGWTDIFIYPSYEFKIVDAMITNFHLPKSSLLVLVSAFAGRNNVLNAYSYAIKNKFRFYSYGDAMLIV